MSIFYLLIFVVIAFMLWTTYSQQRRARRAADELQRMIKKGDEVVTVGGMFGTVRKVGDDYIVLEIAERTRVRFLKRSIREIVNEEEGADDEDDDADYVEDEYDDAEYVEDDDTAEGDDKAEAEAEPADEPADDVEAPKPPTPPKS